jgi:hypothetical protein
MNRHAHYTFFRWKFLAVSGPVFKIISPFNRLFRQSFAQALYIHAITTKNTVRAQRPNFYIPPAG